MNKICYIRVFKYFFLMVVVLKTNKHTHKYIALSSEKNLKTMDTPKEHVPNTRLEELKAGLDCQIMSQTAINI